MSILRSVPAATMISFNSYALYAGFSFCASTAVWETSLTPVSETFSFFDLLPRSLARDDDRDADRISSATTGAASISASASATTTTPPVTTALADSATVDASTSAAI